MHPWFEVAAVLLNAESTAPRQGPAPARTTADTQAPTTAGWPPSPAGSNPSSDCPNTQTIWTNLTSGSPKTLDQIITENLQGIVSVAARAAPWTHVVNIGYPYIVNSTNVCYADSGSWHGSKSVVDKLNTDHTNVTGANVKYVDLTTSGNFGTSPVANNYIQLFRLYGYPHPSGTGQDKIAAAAAATASGSGW
jgi:hypothetical protein